MTTWMYVGLTVYVILLILMSVTIGYAAAKKKTAPKASDYMKAAVWPLVLAAQIIILPLRLLGLLGKAMYSEKED